MASEAVARIMNKSPTYWRGNVSASIVPSDRIFFISLHFVHSFHRVKKAILSKN